MYFVRQLQKSFVRKRLHYILRLIFRKQEEVAVVSKTWNGWVEIVGLRKERFSWDDNDLTAAFELPFMKHVLAFDPRYGNCNKFTCKNSQERVKVAMIFACVALWLRRRVTLHCGACFVYGPVTRQVLRHVWSQSG